jgi:hypothetical protein
MQKQFLPEGLFFICMIRRIEDKALPGGVNQTGKFRKTVPLFPKIPVIRPKGFLKSQPIMRAVLGISCLIVDELYMMAPGTCVSRILDEKYGLYKVPTTAAWAKAHALR